MNLTNFKTLRAHMAKISPKAYNQGYWFAIVNRESGRRPERFSLRDTDVTGDLSGVVLPDPMTGCTAAACLAGHCVYIKNNFKRSAIKADIAKAGAGIVARRWLGISSVAADRLFRTYPDYWPKDLKIKYLSSGDLRAKKEAAVKLLDRIIAAKSVMKVLTEENL